MAKISRENIEYIDAFSPDLATKLLDHIRINQYAIELVQSKQPLYRPIYSPSLAELKTIITFIKTHPKPEFVCPSNSLIRASILFHKKSNSNLVDSSLAIRLIYYLQKKNDDYIDRSISLPANQLCLLFMLSHLQNQLPKYCQSLWTTWAKDISIS